MRIDPIHPGIIFIIAALLVPIARWRRLKQFILLFAPFVAFIDLLYLKPGKHWLIDFVGYRLVLGYVDKLSMVFAYVFVIMAFLGMVYALHVEEDGQHTAAFFYVAGALGVTFAGDFFTLFAFWELMAASSVFLIWYEKTKRALLAGFRYLMVHLFGGCILLAGIIIYVVNRGSIEITRLTMNSLGEVFILIGFILNAAVPPLHAWLPDAYPEGTITGSVFLTAYTTKSAVYILARVFPGVELLMWLGAIMAVYGVVFAIMEDEIRRLLAYHIVSQVGYMVCGVGIGTEMAINGSSAHAFCHILYKALLFMGAGGVIYATGRRRMIDLEGRDLYKKMPMCLALYMVGAFSISAVPLFNGFISKNMVVAAAGEAHKPIIEMLLHIASVGTFLSVGLKLPWRTWFGRSSGVKEEIEVKKLPANMLLAMALTSFLCIFTGCYPKILYDILPYPVHYHPYTAYHVVSMMQLLLLTALGFWLLIDRLKGEATITLDTDWFYRKGGVLFLRFCYLLNGFREIMQEVMTLIVEKVVKVSRDPIYAAESVFIKGEHPEDIPYYDADKHRSPSGLGVLISLVLLSLFCYVFYAYLK